MRDLLLWRLLLASDAPRDPRLAGLLASLAERPLGDRMPYLGLLPRVLGAEDEAVRAPAYACLAGARGHDALRHAVRGLADDEPAVRAAALSSLRASAAHDSARWVHALYHPRAEVRALALATPPKRLDTALLLPLLMDGQNAATVSAALEGQLPYEPPTVWFLVSAYQAGRLPPELVRPWLAGLPWSSLTPRYLGEALPTRRVVPSSASLTPELLEARLAAELEPDPLDAVAELLLSDEAGAARTRWLEGLARAVHGRTLDELQHPRLAFAVLTAMRRLGVWTPLGLAIGATSAPAVLLLESIPLGARQAACKVLGAVGHGDALAPHLDRFVGALAQTPAGLDLTVLAGLLSGFPGAPWKKLLSLMPLAELITACRASPEAAMQVVAIPATDKGETSRADLLLRALVDEDPPDPTLIAWLMVGGPASRLERMLKIQRYGEAWLPVFVRAILDVTAGRELSEERLTWISTRLRRRMALGPLSEVLGELALRPDAVDHPVVRELMTGIGRAAGRHRLAAELLTRSAEELRTLIDIIGQCPGFPHDREQAVAAAALGHADPEIASWAAETVASTPAGEKLPTVEGARALKSRERDRLASCDDGGLTAAIRACGDGPLKGLASALAGRERPALPCLEAAVALLSCPDAPVAVAESFRTLASASPAFVLTLDSVMVARRVGRTDMGLLGHAWLYRWDQHGDAFADLACRWPDGVSGTLWMGLGLPSRLLGATVWQAVALVISRWRYRDPERLRDAIDAPVVRLAIDLLCGKVMLADGGFVAVDPRDLGAAEHLARVQASAAKILTTLHAAGHQLELLESHRGSVIEALASLDLETRHVLSRWIDGTGVEPAGEPRVLVSSAGEDLLARVRATVELDRLAQWCRHDDPAVAQEAALVLAGRGTAGGLALLDALAELPLPPHRRLVVAALGLVPDGAALEAARRLSAEREVPAELRFLVGAELIDRGELERFAEVAEAIVAPDQARAWFHAGDWKRLVHAGISEHTLALALVTSPHFGAYSPAVHRLLAGEGGPGKEALRGLRAFLDTDSDRMRELRLRAADALRKAGDPSGAAILIRYDLVKDARGYPSVAKSFSLAGVPREVVAAATEATLFAGQDVAAGGDLLHALASDGVDRVARQAAYLAIVRRTAHEATQETANGRLRPLRSRLPKLRRLAEIFAWGVRTGQEVLGRIYSIKMIAGDAFAYTRLEEPRLYINCVPLLRGERDGEAVVRGLILHELGHHIYNGSDEDRAIWNEAQKEGLGNLLNLVADEHLERNLRAKDDRWGNLLKTLASYAFQHSRKEIAARQLVAMLHIRAFDVLTRARLHVARRDGHVGAEIGSVFRELEAHGASFGRFMRALRMGLGNRHGDPKVAEALALFRGARFRGASMERMLEIARELQRIFGAETALLNDLDQHGLTEGDKLEAGANREGISERELDQEVERILEPPRHSKKRLDGAAGAPPKLAINVGADEAFTTIDTIVPIAYDRAMHQPYATQVARWARLLRDYLAQLGLRMEPARQRVQGRSVDRPRLRSMLLRRDPRVLVARQPVYETDLFMGVVIDCSGSMGSGTIMERAKLFGVLLAEAVRQLDGVDARFFGFTDSTIYDAGTAQRCAVSSLEVGGGNNDAAALYHAANVARASRRTAKLLVMISDGLPTECSTHALKGLVDRLTTRGRMVCAQVALRSLSEECFPHYVELLDEDATEAVRRFGSIVARLVRRALNG